MTDSTEKDELVMKYSKRKLKRMNKAKIIQIAKNQGLLTHGTKAELIERILKAQKDREIETEKESEKTKYN